MEVVQRDSSLNPLIPGIGDNIIGKVTKITSKYAGVDILLVEGSIPLGEPVKGTLRIQDIFPIEEKDISNIQHSYRPGDIISGKIIGIGDPSAGFLLSTGLSAEHGVLYAKSTAAGVPLLPYSWNEMICSKTGIKERRKCAKPKSLMC